MNKPEAWRVATRQFAWGPLPSRPDLNPGEVHLVTLFTHTDRRPGRSDWSLLTEPETRRAERLRFDWHRNRWVAGRVGIKRLLARYLDCDAADIRFGFGPIGKPFLAEPGLQPLTFNYTDSGGHLIYALGWDQELGVDLEHLPRKTNYEGLARRKLSPDEQAAFAQVPESHRELAFLAHWTRKEAYGKARGVGIRYPMAEVSLCEDYSDPAYVVTRGSGSPWYLDQIATPFNGIAALVTQGGRPRISAYQADRL